MFLQITTPKKLSQKKTKQKPVKCRNCKLALYVCSDPWWNRFKERKPEIKQASKGCLTQDPHLVTLCCIAGCLFVFLNRPVEVNWIRNFQGSLFKSEMPPWTTRFKKSSLRDNLPALHTYGDSCLSLIHLSLTESILIRSVSQDSLFIP